jgi:hypothetical protein
VATPQIPPNWFEGRLAAYNILISQEFFGTAKSPNKNLDMA